MSNSLRYAKTKGFFIFRNIGFLAPFLFLFCAFSCSGSPESREQAVPALEDAVEAYHDGRAEEAAADLRAILEADDGNMPAKRQLVTVYRELGNYRGMIKLLEDIVDSGGEDLCLDLFEAYYLSGEPRKAAAFRNRVEAAIRYAPSRGRAEFLFFDAMIHREQGNDEEAIERFRESLALNRYRPIAWFSLGELLEKSSPREAENCYRNVVSQDAAFTQALYPLGKALAARNAWTQAVDILGRAARRFPDDPEIAAAFAEARRRTGDQSAAELIRGKIGANPPRLTPPPGESLIRIGLAENRELVSVKSGGAFRIRSEGAAVVYRGRAREQIWIAWNPGTGEQGRIDIQDANGGVVARSGEPLTLEYDDPADTSIVAGVVPGYPGTNRTYRGRLEFRPAGNGMTVVNIVNIEAYLYGVIPAEMPADWPEEAIRAQAIAARSYSLAMLGQFADRGFDLYGSPRSMAYHGAGEETKITTQAVNDTRGVILRGGGEPIKAYFSANHGGYSEDSRTMWGYDAYMAAVPDILLPERTGRLPLDELDAWIHEAPFSFSSVSPFYYPSSYRWEKWVSVDEICRRLPENPGEIRRIVSRGRGISGRIYELEVEGKDKSVFVRGDAIWAAMGALRSSLFTIGNKFDKSGNVEYVIFKGAGHGHGIGLDQHGAAGMANAGYSAEEILRHYYPRAELVFCLNQRL
ncbi:MAG: SpoIID/LytB domain-containing protein [Treponema sp.]|jgi:SpoIID/LytB domain protein|nr:SpoIID/LytB domain-containing protein [Treponema sp.]